MASSSERDVQERGSSSTAAEKVEGRGSSAVWITEIEWVDPNSDEVRIMLILARV